jgi:hypothetical protein
LNQEQTRTVARFLNSFLGNLDEQDPQVTGGFATDHDVILFNNAGVANSGGET